MVKITNYQIKTGYLKTNFQQRNVIASLFLLIVSGLFFILTGVELNLRSISSQKSQAGSGSKTVITQYIIQNWRLYSNKTLGFSHLLPTNWTLEEIDDLSPIKRVHWESISPPAFFTVKAGVFYDDQSKRPLTFNEVALQENPEEAKNGETITVANQPGIYQRIYRDSSNLNPRHTVFTQHDDFVYVISMGWPITDSERQITNISPEAVFNQIISSFKFSDIPMCQVPNFW